MKILGKLAFMTLLPLLRRYLRRTSRAYVLVEHQGEILVVKNWLGRQKWQLPGGGLRKNETPPAAAARELREELDITVAPEKFKKITAGVWQADKLSFSYTVYIHKIDYRPPLKLLRPEIIEAAWLDPLKLNANDTTAEVLAAARSASLI